MRILVVGGTGFIGPYVVSRLSEMGHDVTVLHRGQTEAPLPARVRHVHTPEAAVPVTSFPETLKNPAPEVVLHMVPVGQRDARALMDHFRGVARRVVALSSGDVYRAYGALRGLEVVPATRVPLTEEAPLRQRLYPYRGLGTRGDGEDRPWVDGYEKILVERQVLGDPRLPGTILRLPMVYGPGDGQHRLFDYLRRMDDGRPAILMDEGLAQWRWTRGYVENVAAAIVLAVIRDRAQGRIFNVGEADPESEAEWVRRIGQIAGWEGHVVVVPRERLPAHLAASIDTDHHLVLDTSRIRDELDYVEPVGRDEALRRTIAWERANPPATIDPASFDYAAEDAALSGL